MTGKLSKNFHGVGIGPLSIILAVKCAARVLCEKIENPTSKDFHSIVAHVHKYLICGTFYANPIDKLYNYTKMLSLKLTT